MLMDRPAESAWYRCPRGHLRCSTRSGCANPCSPRW